MIPDDSWQPRTNADRKKDPRRDHALQRVRRRLHEVERNKRWSRAAVAVGPRPWRVTLRGRGRTSDSSGEEQDQQNEEDYP
jgi:hypothetical protein